MFKALWDSVSGLLTVAQAVMNANVVGTMTVAGGLVLALFWLYAVYKIIELFSTYHGEGMGGSIWTVWEKARRPMVVYVLMFIGPILASVMTGMATSKATAGLNTMKTSIGQALARVDSFYSDDMMSLSFNVMQSVQNIVQNGSASDNGSTVDAALGEMSKYAAAQGGLKGLDPDKRKEVLQHAIGAASLALQSATLLQDRIDRLGQQRHSVSEGLDMSLFPGAAKTPQLTQQLAQLRTSRLKAIDAQVSDLITRQGKLRSDAITLKGYIDQAGSPKEILADNFTSYDSLFVGAIKELYNDAVMKIKTAYGQFLGLVFLFLPLIASVSVGISLFKEGFQTCMYIVGFVTLCLVGNAIAAPLAPVFMLTMVSNTTESYGRSYINFFLSMVFAAAGVEAMAILAGRSVLGLVNLSFMLTTLDISNATSYLGLLSEMIKCAALIFSIGMASSFCLGLVKRGAALGSGILSGGFPA
jgi:hypothetical protein